jgi:hypothetical protein
MLAKKSFKKNIICKECKKETERYGNTRYCFKCYIKIQREKDKQRQINKIKTEKIKTFICKQCGKSFTRPSYYPTTKYCGRTCYHLNEKKSRLGKNNPCWRGGFKSYGNGHKKACSDYRKLFLKEHSYLYCEKCGRSDALRYETHHIVYASEAPKHKELHNKKNLILTCIGCHNKLHAKKSERNNLVRKRNLNKLFNKNLIIKKI